MTKRDERPSWVPEGWKRTPDSLRALRTSLEEAGDGPFGQLEWPELGNREGGARRIPDNEVEGFAGRVPRLQERQWNYVLGLHHKHPKPLRERRVDAAHAVKNERPGAGSKQFKNVIACCTTILDWLATPYSRNRYDDYIAPPEGGASLTAALNWWTGVNNKGCRVEHRCRVWPSLFWRYIEDVWGHGTKNEDIDNVLRLMLVLGFSEGHRRRMDNDVTTHRGLLEQQQHRATWMTMVAFCGRHHKQLFRRAEAVGLQLDEVDRWGLESFRELGSLMGAHVTTLGEYYEELSEKEVKLLEEVKALRKKRGEALGRGAGSGTLDDFEWEIGKRMAEFRRLREEYLENQE